MRSRGGGWAGSDHYLDVLLSERAGQRWDRLGTNCVTRRSDPLPQQQSRAHRASLPPDPAHLQRSDPEVGAHQVIIGYAHGLPGRIDPPHKKTRMVRPSASNSLGRILSRLVS